MHTQGLTYITRDIGRDFVHGTPRLHLSPRLQAGNKWKDVHFGKYVVHGAPDQEALIKEWQRYAQVSSVPSLDP